MANDGSHDDRSAADSGASPEGIDPWSEFLSESSEELQQLQGTGSADSSDATPQADDSRPGVSIVPVPGAFDTAPFVSEAPSIEPSATELPERLPPIAVPVEAPPAIETPVSYESISNEPEPAAAPLRDGAPPFTRRFAARSYESPFPVAPPPPPDVVTPPPIVTPVGDEASSTPRATPTSSIWKTTPDAAPDRDLRQPVARDERVQTATTAPVAAVESAPARSTTPARPSVDQGASSICLSDVLSRQTPVQWPEAVATVEELCGSLVADGSGQVLIPDLADIFITSAGAVSIRENAPGETDVAALGRALHSLLATSTTPLPLRLFVTSAIAIGRFASVTLFADALSYYATSSGRAALIHALYKRAIERPAVRAVVAPRPPLPPPEPASIVRVQTRRLAKKWRFAAAAAIAVIALAGVWLWAAGLSSADDKAAMNAVGSSPQKRTEDWAPGPILVDPGPETAPVPPVSATPRAENRLVTRLPRVAPPPDPPVPAPAAVPFEPATTAAPAITPPLYTLPAPAVRSAPAPPPSKPAAVVDTKIYSAADLDVEPPVLLSPMIFLPTPVSPSERTLVRTLELLIGTDGRVQRAKLLETTRLSDANVPQQAKLLKFRAAVKDGRAVMYQHRMRLTPPPN